MGMLLRRALAVAAVVWLTPRASVAMGTVVGPTGHTVSIASARVAVAASDGRTTRWAQIRVTSDTEAFAWLVPVLPGARVDLASDAWLDALDASTVPVVLPPSWAPSCGASISPQVATPQTSPASRLPAQALLALDQPSLASFATSAGFEIPSELDTGLSDVFASGGSMLALVYAAGTTPVRTLRIVDGGPATLPFALSGSTTGDAEVTAFAIAASAIEAGSSPLHVARKSLTWTLAGMSNYAAEAASLLESAGGKEWLVQSAGPGPFFAQTTIDVGLSLPAVTADYYLLASTYGDTPADPATCAVGAVGTMASATAYEAACPAGALAVVPGASPCVASPPDATPISGLLCGPAVDAALAVANLSPSDIWVTRLDGLVTPAFAADVSLEGAGTKSEPIELVAGGAPACALADAGSADEGGFPEGGWTDDGGSVSWGDDGGSSGGSGSSGSGGGDGGIASALSDVASASGGCDSSSTTSDGTTDDSSGCGGDSSSPDSSGCSGGDTSDSGGGCSGEDNSCTTARHGRRRSPVSRLIVVAAVIAAIARKRRRS